MFIEFWENNGGSKLDFDYMGPDTNNEYKKLPAKVVHEGEQDCSPKCS